MAKEMRAKTARVMGVFQGVFQTAFGAGWVANPVESRIEAIRWLDNLDLARLDEIYDFFGMAWMLSGILLIIFSFMRGPRAAWVAFFVSFLIPLGMAAIFVIGQLDGNAYGAYRNAMVYIWLGLPVAIVNLVPVPSHGVKAKAKEEPSD